MKRAAETAARAGGAIERFIERTLAPRMEELTGEIRGLRAELGQLDRRQTENMTSLRNEMMSLRNEMSVRLDSLRTELISRIDAVNTRIDAVAGQVNTRIDALSQRLDDALNIRERLIALESKFAARNS